jgi:cytochrome P450
MDSNQMSDLNSLLSSSQLILVILCSIITGFICTLALLHSQDTRVFDRAGQYIPSPASSLWDANIGKSLKAAAIAKNLSAEVGRALSEVGDGSIVGFNSPTGHHTIIVAHPELVKHALSGHHLKFVRVLRNERLAFFMGNGLCTAHGSRWHDGRQVIAPAFQAEQVNAMIGNFNRQSQKLATYWRGSLAKLSRVQPEARSIPVHVRDDVDGLIMSAMCCSCFGYDFQADPNRDTIAAAFSAVRHEMSARCADPHSWWHWLWPTRTRVTRAAVHVLWTLLDDVISKRLAEHSALLARRGQREGSSLPNTTSTQNNPYRNQVNVDTAEESAVSSTGPNSPLLPLYTLSPSHPARKGIITSAASSPMKPAPDSLFRRMSFSSPQKPGQYASPSKPAMLMRDISLNSIEAATGPSSPDSSGSPAGSPDRDSQRAKSTGTSSVPTAVRERDLLDWLVQHGSNDNNINTNYNNNTGAGEGAPQQARCLSRTEIRDQLCTLLIAGHEATSACLQWTLYELCRHPEVQERCQREIDAVAVRSDGSRRQHLSSEDVGRLSYLVLVLTECMRLHPVTGTLERRCEADCVLGDYQLRPGTTVLVSVQAAHRHPDFWADPLVFKPERFSKDNIRATIKHPYQYLPFGAGPHTCVGQRMGLLEVLVVLATLLGHFTFSLAAKDSRTSVQEEETFTIHPKDLNVVVSLRP